MAKTNRADAGEPRQKSDVYVGMLALAALSMAVGVGLLAWEGEEYEWESQPKYSPVFVAPAPVAPRLDGQPLPKRGALNRTPSVHLA